jgi:GNAT superfamily N-acetyltransferase
MSAISLKRTDSDDADFRSLVVELDRELAIRDGADHGFYAQFNKIDLIRHVVVAFDGDVPVGCGAIKSFGADAMEIKRMFVPPEQRGKRIAALVLEELEKWAIELGATKCVLETGYKQPEAIALYTRSGYLKIPNYGQYVGMDNSVCFEKPLSQPVD